MNTNSNIKYETIAASTKIFRGDNNIYNSYNNNNLLTGTYKFFGFSREEVETYGVAYEFETLNQLKLVRLDDQATREHIYNNSNEEIQRILKINYGHNEKNIRYSESSSDYKMSSFLCNSGYDGYMIEQMNTNMGGTFHREMCICNPKKNVRFVQQLTNNEEATKMRNEYKLKLREIEDKEARRRSKQRPVYDLMSPNRATNNMNNNSGNNFGNNSKNNKNSTKSSLFGSRLFGNNNNNNNNNFGYETPGGGKYKIKSKNVMKTKKMNNKGNKGNKGNKSKNSKNNKKAQKMKTTRKKN